MYSLIQEPWKSVQSFQWSSYSSHVVFLEPIYFQNTSLRMCLQTYIQSLSVYNGGLRPGARGRRAGQRVLRDAASARSWKVRPASYRGANSLVRVTIRTGRSTPLKLLVDRGSLRRVIIRLNMNWSVTLKYRQLCSLMTRFCLLFIKFNEQHINNKN
jgi:hypothetical protein